MKYKYLFDIVSVIKKAYGVSFCVNKAYIPCTKHSILVERNKFIQSITQDAIHNTSTGSRSTHLYPDGALTISIDNHGITLGIFLYNDKVDSLTDDMEF